jgi:hypothetical protein
MYAPRPRLLAAALIAALGAPAAALAQSERLTPAGVFLDADPVMKLVMVALVASAMAAVVVGTRKLMSGPRLTGGSAYLSALRLGAPLLGLLGAAYVALFTFIGVSNSPTPVPFGVLAPGLAEAVLVLVLGLFAGAVAVAFHWAVEARIDRAVLTS